MATKKDNTGTDEAKGPQEPDGQQVPATLPKPDWNMVIAEVKERVRQRKHLQDRGGLDIGILVFDTGFNGDLSKVQDKNPLKGTSLADLAKKGEIGVDSTTLGNWVRSGALYRWFEKNGHPLEHLTTSHFIALLPLQDEDKKKELAIMANNSGWSVRGLREQVAVVRGVSLVNWGREAVKKLGNPKALLADENLPKFLADKDWLLNELNNSERTNLKAEIDAVNALFAEHKSILTQLEDNLDQIKAAKPALKIAV